MCRDTQAELQVISILDDRADPLAEAFPGVSQSVQEFWLQDLFLDGVVTVAGVLDGPAVASLCVDSRGIQVDVNTFGKWGPTASPAGRDMR